MIIIRLAKYALLLIMNTMEFDNSLFVSEMHASTSFDLNDMNDGSNLDDEALYKSCMAKLMQYIDLTRQSTSTKYSETRYDALIDYASSGACLKIYIEFNPETCSALYMNQMPSSLFDSENPEFEYEGNLAPETAIKYANSLDGYYNDELDYLQDNYNYICDIDDSGLSILKQMHEYMSDMVWKYHDDKNVDEFLTKLFTPFNIESKQGMAFAINVYCPNSQGRFIWRTDKSLANDSIYNITGPTIYVDMNKNCLYNNIYIAGEYGEHSTISTAEFPYLSYNGQIALCAVDGTYHMVNSNLVSGLYNVENEDHLSLTTISTGRLINSYINSYILDDGNPYSGLSTALSYEFSYVGHVDGEVWIYGDLDKWDNIDNNTKVFLHTKDWTTHGQQIIDYWKSQTGRHTIDDISYIVSLIHDDYMLIAYCLNDIMNDDDGLVKLNNALL